jgi:hypothetical protein
MLRLSKSGAVCSRQSAFATMRMAFFCCLNIAVVLVSDVHAYMLVQYRRCVWKKLV